MRAVTLSVISQTRDVGPSSQEIWNCMRARRCRGHSDRVCARLPNGVSISFPNSCMARCQYVSLFLCIMSVSRSISVSARMTDNQTPNSELFDLRLTIRTRGQPLEILKHCCRLAAARPDHVSLTYVIACLVMSLISSPYLPSSIV